MPKGTVLLVDDDLTLLKLIRLLLEDEGYQVSTANGDEAVSTARTQQPNVILLDVRMPGIGGVGISRQLRENPETRHIPIIGITADLARGIREGMVADEWIGKPFDVERLCQGVARWVGKRSPAAQPPSENLRPRPDGRDETG
ncbi:MAG TPA: response regulator [Chloroflexota bacterium]|nr:response regulator [Chloroflexota bacterium]